MRKALVVGIDHYEHCEPLHGCVDDAYSVKAALERHADGSVNFGVVMLTGTGANDAVSRGTLKDKIEELFKFDDEIALFYFAGHGSIESSGGYILTSDCKRGDDGVSLSDIVQYANNCRARSRLIILDSCHAGFAAATRSDPTVAELRDGTTILTASTAEQYASETATGGVFTNLLVDALGGSAANILGEITAGAVYAHIDQSLGPWSQRPVFKTNVKNFVVLRRVVPAVSQDVLRQIGTFFPKAGAEFQLDPTFEGELTGRPADAPGPNPENVAKLKILQKYNRVNLVVPVGVEHMWNAAIQSKTCRLTVLGEHYRKLVERDLI